MKNKKMVSILIPAFNEEKYIKRAVESALSQKYQSKEIVAADDGSTDSTWQVLQKYQNRPQFRIARNLKNLGRVANHRHLLYDLTRGDYVVMLDGDDYFLDDDFIADAIEMAIVNNLRLVFAEAKAQNVKGGQIRHVTFPFIKTDLIPYQEIFKKGVLFMHGAVLYKRDLAFNYDFYSKNIIADDNESFLRFVAGEKVGFIKRPVYVYQWDNSPDRYNLQLRIENTLMVESVHQFALKRCPQEKKLFNWWRERMLATFFYGNSINLAYHQKFQNLFAYIAEYIQRYGLANLLTTLKHPLVAYHWGGY